jgi:MFS family permease
MQRLGFNAWTQQYQPLYTISLGASLEQLGLLTTLGNLVNPIVTMPMGWLADKFSVKKTLLLGMVMEILIPLIYALAWDWQMLIPAAIFGVAETSVLTLVENVIIANALKDEERGTGFGIINSLSMVPAIFSPMIAVYIVAAYGGLNAEGIRPLFWIMALTGVMLLIFMFIFLEEERVTNSSELPTNSGLFKDFKNVFNEGVALKRMLACSLLDGLGFGMMLTYSPVFAVNVKGATPIILGLMGITQSLGTLLAAGPIGRLADKIGRKRAMYTIKPIWYLSTILFILAPSPEFLVFVFILRSLSMSTGLLWQTMQMELVPPSQRGRWSSIINLFRLLTTIPAPLIGSWLWTQFDPSMPFIVHTILDVGLLMPTLSTIPETLKRERKGKLPQKVA